MMKYFSKEKNIDLVNLQPDLINKATHFILHLNKPIKSKAFGY